MGVNYQSKNKDNVTATSNKSSSSNPKFTQANSHRTQTSHLDATTLPNVSSRAIKELKRLEESRFTHANSKPKGYNKPLNPVVLTKKINKPLSVRFNKSKWLVNSKQKNETNMSSNSKTKRTDITSHLRTLQLTLDELSLDNIEKYGSHFGNTGSNSEKLASLDIDSKENYDLTPLRLKKLVLKTNKKNVKQPSVYSKDRIDYWTTVHSIESKQGKLLYRPRNKDRNCTNTSGPCGHHQLTVQALKDIGCNSKQCRIDRLNYKKSLTLSKKLLALNEKRLKKNGITQLEDYQRYLIHQQGANGIKNIIKATQGKKTLSKEIKKNMANNSPYSYRQLKRMGSTIAAKKFMQHWKKKWRSEQRLVLASVSKTTDSLINSSFVPTFSDTDLNFALNIKF